MTVENVTPGMILACSWSSQSNMTFFIHAPDSSTPISYHHEGSKKLESNGLMVDQAGTYSLSWRSEAVNATVAYVSYAVTPKVTLTSPPPGSTITNLTPNVGGTYDSMVSSITISVNGGNFSEARMNKGNWSLDVSMAPGLNTVVVKANYAFGNFTHTVTQTANYTVDNQWVYTKDKQLHVGETMLIFIIAVVAIIAAGFGFLFYRAK